MNEEYQRYRVIPNWWDRINDIFKELDSGREVSRKRGLSELTTEELAATLRRVLTNSLNLNNKINIALMDASVELSRAESEYHHNAFAPFWDAVENAAQDLNIAQTAIKDLAKNARLYYNILSNRRHTFPTFNVRLESIPDPMPLAEELRRIVRMGQTNFQFATIWEHRRTRECLIAGFRTLGEAINNLDQAIVSSIVDLRDSISSDLARVIEEHIATREAIERKKGRMV
ncbi:MAG: hypothetical protein AB1797_01375 [bacterium]